MPQPIAICLGSASEALRLAPVVREFRRRDVPAVVVTLARPTRMFDDMLATFAVERGVDLTPAIAGATAAARTDTAIRALGGALAFVRPAAVVLHADTATAFCAAPAAFSRGIPVAQVDAGVRTGPAAAPFAGEADRRLVGQLATWHFAPDAAARANLVGEGIDPATIDVTSGAVAEAARWIAERDGLLARRPGAGRRRILVVLRRGGGRDGADRAAGRVLARLAERADVELIVAAPRSPVLRAELAAHDNVTVLAAPRYDRFLAALASSHLLLSDAPAAHEAGSALGVPGVVLADPALALQHAERALDDGTLERRLVPVPSPEQSPAARILERLAGDRAAVAAAEVHSASGPSRRYVRRQAAADHRLAVSSTA